MSDSDENVDCMVIRSNIYAPTMRSRRNGADLTNGTIPYDPKPPKQDESDESRSKFTTTRLHTAKSTDSAAFNVAGRTATANLGMSRDGPASGTFPTHDYKRNSFENGLLELGGSQQSEGNQPLRSPLSFAKRKDNPTTSSTTTTKCIQTAPLCETPPLPTLSPVPLTTLHDHLLHLTKKLHLYKLHILDTERQMKTLQDRNDILVRKLKMWRDFRKYLVDSEHLKPVRDLLDKWIEETTRSPGEQEGEETTSEDDSSEAIPARVAAPKEREEHPYKALARRSSIVSHADSPQPLSASDLESNSQSQKLLSQSKIILSDTKLEEFLKQYHAEYFMLHDVHSSHIGRYYLWMEHQEKLEKERAARPTVLEDDELDLLLDSAPYVRYPSPTPSPPPEAPPKHFRPDSPPEVSFHDQGVEVEGLDNPSLYSQSPDELNPTPINSITQIKLDQARTELKRQKLEMERQKREIAFLKHQLKGIREIERDRIRREIVDGGSQRTDPSQQYPAHILEVQPSSLPSTLQKQTSSGHLLERLKKIKSKYNSPASLSARAGTLSTENSPPKEDGDDLDAATSTSSAHSTPTFTLPDRLNPTHLADTYDSVSPQDTTMEISSPRLKRPSTSGALGRRNRVARKTLRSAAGSRRTAPRGSRPGTSNQMSMESFLDALPPSDKPNPKRLKKDKSSEKFSYDPQESEETLTPRPPSMPKAPPGGPKANGGVPQRRWKSARPQTAVDK